MMKLNNISSPKGTTRKNKRIGRGQGSGRGTQAGKGHKGQKARSGGGVRTGFEGGAMPLYMRLPKKGFTNRFAKKIATISTGLIQKHFDSGEVSREALIKKGLLKGADRKRPIKVLLKGELKNKLSFVGIEKFSKSAKELISSVGGEIK